MDDHNQHTFPYGLIQVAGVHDMSEAQSLLDAGVDLIGLPLRLTVNQEDLSEEAAAELCKRLPGRCCLITYLNKTEEIVRFTLELGVDCVQLHGDVNPAIMPDLNTLLPNVRFIKSLVIGKGEKRDLFTTIDAFSPYVWAFITDTYNPVTGAEGATGMTHDWSLSREISQYSSKPVILAGGLTPTNVSEAISQTECHGVDVHTGVEGLDGRKDPCLVEAFIRNSKSVFTRTSL